MITKVVIAAAGQGTRMKHLTKNKSKHLINVNENKKRICDPCRGDFEVHRAGIDRAGVLPGRAGCPEQVVAPVSLPAVSSAGRAML